MPASSLPPCGLYRTSVPLGDAIPAGKLVYFHNHGDPGPGVYLPERWIVNRAEFSEQGFTLPGPIDATAATLKALPDEGFYRVTERFFCCEKKCRAFEPELLVQLGYNSEGEPILFLPELTTAGLALPATGQAIAPDQLEHLSALVVPESEEQIMPAQSENLH